MRPFHRIAAFSLVELSIVLVILGLLVGGVLSGQSLIHAAELRSVSSEYDTYRTAVGTFRDKYFGLPGDLNNAANFGWKDAAGTALSNGNGNGYIENSATAASNETSSFWIELADAGLITGSYTQFNSGISAKQSTNVPGSKYSGIASWNISAFGNVQVDGSNNNVTGPYGLSGWFFAGNYGHAFVFGSPAKTNQPDGVMKPEDAWNIDSKIDDGKPDQGRVLSPKQYGSSTSATSCSDQDSSNTAMPPSNYALTHTSQTACALVFKTGY